jgi:hypothetical protein
MGRVDDRKEVVWFAMAGTGNCNRLDLNELSSYFQRLSANEKFTKYCEYLLQRIINILTEYHYPGTLHSSVSIKEKYSSYKPPHEISNEKLYQIVEKVYQFYQEMMKNSWSLRQHIYQEENEKRAKLLLQEIDQQLILIVLETDHMIRQYENQRNHKLSHSHRWGGMISNFLGVILFLMMIWFCSSSQSETDLHESLSSVELGNE